MEIMIRMPKTQKKSYPKDPESPQYGPAKGDLTKS